MASAFGAGAGADMLQDVLRRKLQEQALIGQQKMAEARMAQDAEQFAAQQSMASRRMGLDEEQFGLQKQQFDQRQSAADAAAKAGTEKAQRITAILNDPNTPAPLKLALQYSDLTGSNAPSELLKPEKPESKPLFRLGRDGKLTQLGDVPTGAQVINEPAPSGPTHARYNIVQGADAEGKPAMIRTNVDTGQIEVLPVPAGANFVKRDQPATESQSNAALYTNRIEQSTPVLDNLAKHISGMNPLAFKAQEYLDNPNLQSKEMQSYEQASRNFINAVLRRESGAAIAPSEFDSARKQYLPVPGDSDEVLAQKAANRKIVMDNLRRSAGPAYRPIETAKPAGGGNPDAAARAAELIKKYGG